MKKILIVDDSLVYRHALNSALSEERDFFVMAALKNGQEALDYILKNSVDLITLDIEMPVMDGHQLIAKLKSLHSRPKIIVFTSQDKSGADNALKALHEGADDFVTKIAGDGDIKQSISEIKNILSPKIKSLLGITKVGVSQVSETVSSPQIDYSKQDDFKNELRKLKGSYSYIFIGCSTGGPEALRFIFQELRGNKMPPIFIVQHMPPIYTTYLAKSLSENTSYQVVEAKHGDIVKNGICYIAPGDFHMTVISNGSNELKISLNQDEKDCFVRPSVNHLFRSAKFICEKSLFVILTGMGSDGLTSIQYLFENKMRPDVLIQNEESSVVWGMPGEIFHKKLHSEIQGLVSIKGSLLKLI